MGFRFRKSIKVAPGVRLNLNRKGVSATVGVKGAHYTVGTQGRRATVGIPGTGASYTSQHRWKSGTGLRHPSSTVERINPVAGTEQSGGRGTALRQVMEPDLVYRQARADRMTEEVTARVHQLEMVLSLDPSRVGELDFETLKDHTPEPRLEIPAALAEPLPVPVLQDFMPKPLGWFARHFPAKRAAYQQALSQAQEAFEEACTRYEVKERDRTQSIAELTVGHEEILVHHAERQKQQHIEIDNFQEAYRRGEAEAVEAYCMLLLTRARGPHLSENIDLRFDPPTHTVIVDRELPRAEVVPEEERFRYIKSHDEIRSVKRSVAERKRLYSSLVAAVVLRTAGDVLSGTGPQVEACTVRGFVDVVRPETGILGRVHLAALTVTGDSFSRIDLQHVDAVACLNELGGKLSKNPLAYHGI